jgi:thiol reductant ABC exporter CydC subunit
MTARLVEWTRGSRSRLLLAAVAGAAALGSAVALLGTSAWLISRAAEQPPVLYLVVAIVAVRALGIARGLLRYLERLLGHDAALRILVTVRERLFRSLERLAPSGLPAFRSGDLLARLVGDVESGQDVYLRVFVPYAAAALVGTAAVVATTILLPAAGLLLAIALLAAGLLGPLLSAALSRRAERAVAPARGEVGTLTVEALQASGELEVYGAADGRMAALAAADRRLARASATSSLVAGAGAALTVAATGVAVWGALAFGVPAVRAGELGRTELAVVVLIPLACAEVVAGLPIAAQLLTRSRPALDRVVDVMETPSPVSEPARTRPLPDGPGRLRIENLQVRWRPDAPLVIVGFDADLPPGTRQAVVGPSGSGKSTLAAALVRFVDPCGGTITLDGVPTVELDGDDVRRVIGLCTQEAHVYDTTVEQNLRVAKPDATDAELRAALSRARLTDWVAALPRGLDTPVGEHGAQVSGGERQRIALARSLLAEHRIIIFDEPTEHLDPATGDALLADLLDATAGRTVILITHRRDQLDPFDRVIEMGERRGPFRCDSLEYPGALVAG